MAAFEVIALDTATPQLRAPGASDTYTFPRAVEMPLGTANGVLYLNGSKVVTSGSGLVFDSSGNLGLGVTPSAWGLIGPALQVKQASLISESFDQLYLSANAFFDGSWKYMQSDIATQYYQASGAHVWRTAPSGTAGNAISFTQAMTLDASGNLLLGTTNGNGLKLDFSPSSSQQNGITYVNSSPNSYTDIYGCGTSGSWEGAIRFFTSNNAAASERARITSEGNFVVGTAALATSATDGFLYVPTCAGTPTGTPTTQTGTAPIVVDTTNNKLYFYSGGQWRDAGP